MSAFYCRLCAKLETTTVHIFEDVGKRMFLQLKILQYLNLKVTAADPLTKYICILCIGKLDYFVKFLLECQDACVTLRKRLYSSSSMNNDDAGPMNMVVQLENDEISSPEEVSGNEEVINSSSQFASPEIAHNKTTVECSGNMQQESCKEDGIDVKMEVVDGDDEEEEKEIESKHTEVELEKIKFVNVFDTKQPVIDNKQNFGGCVGNHETVFVEFDENHSRDSHIYSNSKYENMELVDSVDMESKHAEVEFEIIKCVNVCDIKQPGIDSKQNLDVCIENVETVSDRCGGNPRGDFGIDSSSTNVNMEVVDGNEEEDESNYTGIELGKNKYINVVDMKQIGINNKLNLNGCVRNLETVVDKCDENCKEDSNVDSNSKCESTEIEGINSFSHGSNEINEHPCVSVIGYSDYVGNRSEDGLNSNSLDETNHESETFSVNDCDNHYDDDIGDNTESEDDNVKVAELTDNNISDICDPHQPDVIERPNKESNNGAMEVDPAISELYFRKKDVEDYGTGVAVRIFHCLQNVFSGKCSIMPYFTKWPQPDKSFRVGFKCFACGIFRFKKTDIIDHIFEHLCYSCDLCKRQLRRKESFLRHMRKFHVIDIENRKFKCIFCSEVMSDIDSYMRHVKQHCEYHCGLCPFQTEMSKDLTRHVEQNHSIDEKDCINCLSVFNNDTQGLTYHVLKITKKDGFVCQFCGIGFHTEGFLKIHYEIYGFNHGQILDGVDAGSSPRKSQKSCEIVVFPPRSDRLFHAKVIEIFLSIVNKKIKCDQLPTIECEVQGKNTALKVKCPFCNHTYYNIEKQIIFHFELHLLITCFKCKRLIQSFKRFKNHLLRYHCLSVYKCVICKNVSFDNLSEYFAHVKLHSYRKMCCYCNDVFPNNEIKEKHIRRVHKDKIEKNHVCDQCGLSFSSNYHLEDHVKRKHSDFRKKLICPDCGKEFMNFYTKHKCLKKKHNDEVFICAYCSKKFNRKNALISHIEVHLNLKTYECKVCKKSFNRLSSLQKHIKDMHSERKWMCTIDDCGKSYTFKSELACHMKRTHNMIEPMYK